MSHQSFVHWFPSSQDWGSFRQPDPELHASEVHAFPSSHDCVPPPTEHAPVRHDFADVNCSRLHVPAPHAVPSVALLHSEVLGVDAHTLHALTGFNWPSAQHVPAIRHCPACSTLPHPFTASHVSLVHAFPSSQPVVAPPVVHSPDWHILAADHVSPAHALARHWIPFARGLQDDVLVATVHASQALPGFKAPPARQIPPIRQFPA